MMPAVGTNFGSPEGEVTDRLISFLQARAKGGAALLTTEGTYINKNGRESKYQLGIHRDDLIPGLKELTDTVHREGAKIFVQLIHAGRQTLSIATGSEIVAPSPVPCKLMREMPRELSLKEIHELIEAYGEAARRAKEANFDGIEILAGHGQLINQFLSPYTNKREDQYGGSPEKRMRFPLEVLERVRKAVGPDFPISVRISVEEFVEGGLTLDDTLEFALQLVYRGIELLHISGGIYETAPFIVQPMLLPQGFFTEYALKIKKALENRVPIAVAGSIKDPYMAEDLLERGVTDLIAMGRPLLADPELPKKAREGRIDDIRKCIRCNQGCMDRMLMQQDITCLGNPLCGYEKEREIKEASEKKKVMVIGGGPAGMEAARVAALRGHSVVLYERQHNLGGQMKLASIPPGKKDMEDLKDFLENQLKKLSVKIVTGCDVDSSTVEEVSPDVVVLASGGRPILPEIPGIEQENVVYAEEILSGEKLPGEKVLLIGGGMVGCETAAFIAQQGKEVILVEMLVDIATDIGFLYRYLLLNKLQELGVKIYKSTAVKKIQEDTVTIEKGSETDELTAISTVVVATGYNTNKELFLQLSKKYQVYSIGDCKEVRKMIDAIHEGFLCGLQI